VIHLLNLLAAIALLVWATQIVRTEVLRVFGERLRDWLSHSMAHRPTAILAGMGVTGLVQSSTATCMIVASFVGKGLVPTAAALSVMLGADIGSAVMVAVFSFDLSWLSPLLIFVGVVLTTSRDRSTAGRLGRVAIGLGLITLALHLIVESTKPLTASPAVRALLVGMPNEVLTHLLVGAVLAVLSYSSLAVVLLTATLASQGMLPASAALGLVLGANVGSGILAVLTTARAGVATRRLPVGNLGFKLATCVIALPLMSPVHVWLQELLPTVHAQVVAFHLGFNVLMALVFSAFTGPMARTLERHLVDAAPPPGQTRLQHLDPLALATPSLAISCAAREALHQADVVETMLRGVLPVLRDNDVVLAEQLRAMDDTVDDLYTAIKLYLTQISRQALSERESRRWTEVVSFTINMEQIGDIIERVLQDIEDKKIRKNRRFSDAGMAEICHLHERLLSNLRLGMSVFLDGHVRDARRLLEEKAQFRELEHSYAATHLARLQDNTAQSIETSSLHLDLISDLKRINSHICGLAYPILETAGALTPTRLRDSRVMSLDADSPEPAPVAARVAPAQGPATRRASGRH
jgi:phosphate:Na+ symporter